MDLKHTSSTPDYRNAKITFGDAGIAVQTAQPVRIKDAEGNERDGFKTGNARLKPEHVLAARQYDDGTVAITTIDGNKHTVKAKPLPAAEADPAQEAHGDDGKK